MGYTASRRPFVTFQARLGGQWSDVKVMDNRALALLQSMVHLLLQPADPLAVNRSLFVTSDNEGPKWEMKRTYGARMFLTAGRSVHVEKSHGNASSNYYKTLLDLYVAGESELAVVSKSSFIQMAMWRRRVPYILVEAQRAGPKQTFITGDVRVFVRRWDSPTTDATPVKDVGWFKPRGVKARMVAEGAVQLLLGGPSP
eukprot:NODE_468_length_1362_cov_268.638233_g337_i0.p2 GENE.NODE_468_length_1362_cov_268.638233_g337_i0~~NODE_468_length_1362_cov_268.638233_g337_i0.p2  ORF type:complete len:207 (-),score=59.78 NODE_468_length_1362_cov_268.638233_g337_i0:742-1338(-)